MNLESNSKPLFISLYCQFGYKEERELKMAIWPDAKRIVTGANDGTCPLTL